MTAKNRKEAEPVFCQVAALRYAKVLNELGISKEAVLEAGNIFEKSQELKAALVNPVITKETKHNIIDKVFSEEMRTFLKVVCDHEKMTIAEQIFAAYEELQNQAELRQSIFVIQRFQVKNKRNRWVTLSRRNTVPETSNGLWQKTRH